MGMDECWLDITGSQRICGNGMEAAEDIRRTMKQELGLTVSIGVSYNKIFAKLGSDMKSRMRLRKSRKRILKRRYGRSLPLICYM